MEPDQVHIRVLVVDDHDLVRAGLIALLNHEKDICIVGEAKGGPEACEKVRALAPDVVLMDINMPGLEGIEATALVAHEHPAVKVLAVTHLDHEEYMRKIMESGASGCISKSCAAEELKQAIRNVHAGGEFFSVSAGRELPDAPGSESSMETRRPVDLTPRETQVIQLVVTGSTSEEIAVDLGISARTVEFHRANIKEKTGARDAISLVRWALRNNIITFDAEPQK